MIKLKTCVGDNGEPHEGYIYKNIDGKKYCKSCALKIKPPKALKKITTKQIERTKDKAIKTKELHDKVLEIWEKRSDPLGNCRCFESNILLESRYFKRNTCCYSHILPKSKYPQYAFEEWNIMIVHPDRHTDFETNEDKAPKQRDLKKKLLENLP